MTNWFDAALKTVGEAAGSIGKNISEATSGLVEAVQGWLPFYDEDMLAFFAVLFAVAATDGDVGEDELSLILSSPEVDKLSVEGSPKRVRMRCSHE